MNIKKWIIISVIVSLILGTLLHFTYEWSGENKFVAIFSAVNESTWEHLKLTFYPMTLMALIGSFFIKKESNNYWFAQATGILFSIIFITIFFYTYTGIIGTNFAIIDIASFVISILLGEYIIYKLLLSKKKYNLEKISIILIFALLLSFIVYTFDPYQIAYFKDPIEGSYGIN